MDDCLFSNTSVPMLADMNDDIIGWPVCVVVVLLLQAGTSVGQ